MPPHQVDDLPATLGLALNATQLAPYNFTYCKGDVQVGKSYEIHYVHSSAGMDNNATDEINADLLADGLGGAANGRGLLNPMIVVQAQIFQIVNGAETVEDMLHGWTVVGRELCHVPWEHHRSEPRQRGVLSVLHHLACGQGLPSGFAPVL